MPFQDAGALAYIPQDGGAFGPILNTPFAQWLHHLLVRLFPLNRQPPLVLKDSR